VACSTEVDTTGTSSYGFGVDLGVLALVTVLLVAVGAWLYPRVAT